MSSKCKKQWLADHFRSEQIRHLTHRMEGQWGSEIIRNPAAASYKNP